MIKILANDGIDAEGKKLLEDAGFLVADFKVQQAELAQVINEQNFNGLIVRSATKVKKDVIDACPGLKLVGRAGVGMDNIDVEYAKSKGITVVNTPEASSQSVAELVFAHLFGLVRGLHRLNRKMPTMGATHFNELKKNFSNGSELKGKTLGVIGFGRIGQAVAKIAVGCGMRVVAFDPYIKEADLVIDFLQTKSTVTIPVKTTTLEDLLAQSDFITLHVSFAEGSPAIIGSKEFKQMKNGVGIVNASRGGVINEADLLDALENGKVAFAGLDVFENEPTPNADILKSNKLSFSPHIGASTAEAQQRIGIEMAQRVLAFFRNK
jgi:D-3-phosphoglycerate dehydrogenase